MRIIKGKTVIDDEECDNCKTDTSLKLDLELTSLSVVIPLCEECIKDGCFSLSNDVYNKKDKPVNIWYCDTDNCGRFIITDKSRTCACGQKYRMNQTPLGVTVDKVMT